MYVLALDQGTTSSRAAVFDSEGEVRALEQRELTQHYPRPGWVEHDALEIWSSQLEVAVAALAQAGATARDVDAIGVANQRETTILWERSTGTPVAPAIVWQDRRTAPMCEQLRQDGLEPLFSDRTGLLLDPYFAGTKLRWMLENIPGAATAAQRGELAFGTVDSWLVWQLSAGQRHVTDLSNASRTLLCNIHTGDWDDELLQVLGVPRELLPTIVPSSGVCAETAIDAFHPSIPICGIAGDQQAALFGQMALDPGITKSTYGTGCFMLMQTGSQTVTSSHQLLTTVAWERAGQRSYALEGSVFVAGAAVQWLRDGLGIIPSAAAVEPLAASVPDSGGLYLVPAFTGLGAPHWDPHATGLITGITRGTTAAHLARATLDSIAHQTADVLDAMAADADMAIPELRVDGGASANDLLMQIQADLLGIPVVRPEQLETTALGAACLAGLGAGCWPDAAELCDRWRIDRRFEPVLTCSRRQELRAEWLRALERTRESPSQNAHRG
jgi:glycerol kinase